MASVEVLGCVSAIVSAFQGGADVVQSIQERRQKKRRRKESDMEVDLPESEDEVGKEHDNEPSGGENHHSNLLVTADGSHLPKNC